MFNCDFNCDFQIDCSGESDPSCYFANHMFFVKIMHEAYNANGVIKENNNYITVTFDNKITNEFLNLCNRFIWDTPDPEITDES